ncbi:MAG: YdeI/OmpD-associated family protein [Chloroflexi bacterium]|nr:YdeI/OmpD-associated family protein [Chloroflexota bacterium]
MGRAGSEWIEEAKKRETRRNRTGKAIDMIALGRKEPS